MNRFLTALPMIVLLTACGNGNPLFDEDGEIIVDEGTVVTGDNGEVPGDGGDIDNDGATPPPGTDDPSLNAGIFRYEARDGDGGGLVTEVAYNSGSDTFFVNNLAFDGANVYQRDTDVPTLRNYRVFAADEQTDDFLTGAAVGQIVPYRAVYGVSNNRVDGDPRTSFAIVRTGGYVPFGFGGYVYERNGGTVLPSQGGQATFSGNYAGIWVLDGAGGLGYVTGDMSLDIDFEDFDENAGVKGLINNRFLRDDEGLVLGPLENVRWVIEEGVMTLDENGEILTQVFTTRVDTEGAQSVFFSGTFDGLLAGDLTRGDGGEVVGVVKMEASAVLDGTGLAGLTGFTIPDGDGTSVTIQETGGAILYRE